MLRNRKQSKSSKVKVPTGEDVSKDEARSVWLKSLEGIPDEYEF